MVDTVDTVDSERPSKKALADALGLSRQMVHKLQQQGMPVHSLKAARAWRKANLREHMTKGYRLSMSDPEPPCRAEIAALQSLWPIARAAIKAGNFHVIEGDVRAALRAVPPDVRDEVHLDFEVIDRLVAPTAAAVDPEYSARRTSKAPAGAAPARVNLSEAEADLMGRFWYSVAAGEPIDWTGFE